MFVDGELVVRNGPTEDVPPDVYEYGFDDCKAILCLRCAVWRCGSMHPTAEVGPLIKGGICEDCGNDG